MNEADTYQQRLLAIAERRRQQEEEEKLRRETEEEWLKTAQEKRKYLRDQWLSETSPPPVLLTLDSFRTGPPLQDEADEHTAEEQTKSQKTPEDEEEEAADARKEEQASQEENKESVNCTAAAGTHSHYQAAADEDAQVNKEAENHFSILMAQRMFHESGQDGRSVLGMLAVQVERDPKTGTTVVKSVAPMSTPADAPTATTVFDDGRKSIHAVGGTGCQPSTEELGQILSVIDGVGMKALLDEVTVTPKEAEMKTEHAEASRTPEEKVVSFSTHHAMSKENDMQLDSTRSYDLQAELSTEDCAVSLGNEDDKQEGRSITAVTDIAGEVQNVEDLRLEEGPVTLLFLGYADATTSQESDEGMLTVERVIITEDGEEHVVGPETSALPPPTSDEVAEQEAGKESQDEVFQDIPLDGNGAGVKVQGQEGDKKLHNSSSPGTAVGEGTSKRKTCQCCSVM
ncbi:paralemmin-1-like [Trachinotus anak]|uniref:paralemmin-1-like n=1 Tax=Trachinotus anak TaxID=443729 RepID=UPI0039F2201A